MKREQKYPDTKTFHYFNANPKNRVTGDCTFRAVCTALGQSWEQTVMEMAEFSCKTGYAINDKKGIERYLESKGWKKRSQPRKANGGKYTGEEWCDYIRKNPEWYSKKIIADIGGHHIVAIVDYKIWDTWDSSQKCIGNWWQK